MQKKSYLRAAILFLTCTGLGFTMPSCPAQKALEQQIAQMKTSESKLIQQVQALETDNAKLREDMNQVKILVEQIGKTVLEHKDALAKLDRLEDLVSKMGSKNDNRTKKPITPPKTITPKKR